jgi:hypothetical protein
MVERHVVEVIESFRLENKMPNLPRPHGHNPPQKTCRNRLEREESVAEQKAHSTEKMKALSNAALVVETVVIPALLLKLFPEGQARCNFSFTVHCFSPVLCEIGAGCTNSESPTRIVEPSITLSENSKSLEANISRVEPFSK